MKEADMMKKQAQEEERMFALQQENLRRQQIISDRQMKRNHRGVQNEFRQLQNTQASDHKQKWVDPYHEKDITHQHPGNLKL